MAYRIIKSDLFSIAATIAYFSPEVASKSTAAIAILGNLTESLTNYAATNNNGFRIYFHTMVWELQARWFQLI